jgi:hypothetical protein
LDFSTIFYEFYKLADLKTREVSRQVPGICTKALKIGKQIADMPLPELDGGRPVCSGAFSPAVRSLAGKI